MKKFVVRIFKIHITRK